MFENPGGPLPPVFDAHGWGNCLQTSSFLSIATTIKLYESALIAIKSQLQSLVFVNLMAITKYCRNVLCKVYDCTIHFSNKPKFMHFTFYNK